MLRELTTGIAAPPLARLVRGAATLAAGDGSLSVRSSSNTIMLQREPSVEGSLSVCVRLSAFAAGVSADQRMRTPVPLAGSA
jgi:hypothetical protein